MRKFILRVATFFAIIIIIDIVCGCVFPYLVIHTRGGDNGRNNYICNETTEDILVFGSSRAIHHYNPQILTDSLGLSCYNCGQDGNGSILNYGRIHMIADRYHPRLLIYDITPGFDLLAGNNRKYLGWLRAYYDRQGIPEIFWDIDKTERWKMMSSMYRSNSRFIQIVSDYIHPQQSLGIKGFRPIDKEMDTMKIGKPEKNPEQYSFDEQKIAYINKILKVCNHETKVIFVVSPIWYGMDTTQLKPLIELCDSHNIRLIDFSNNPKYVHNDIYFKDGSHLNARGADEFTRDLIKELKKCDLQN